MKAMVIIPTTTRPVVITSIRERRGLPASIVVAEGDFRGLPLSADYDKLIGVAGPLGTITGQGGLPSHELRLSQAFESGRSWEVPVCLAHYLVSRGLTLVREISEADLVVWATGAIDLDLGIVRDRYFLSQKIATSIGLLGSLRQGAHLEVCLPTVAVDGTGSAEERKRLQLLGGGLTDISSVGEAVARLKPLIGDTAATAPQPVRVKEEAAEDTPSEGPRRRMGFALVASLATISAVAGAGWLVLSGRLPIIPGMHRVQSPVPPKGGERQQVAVPRPEVTKAEDKKLAAQGTAGAAAKAPAGNGTSGQPIVPKVLNPDANPQAAGRPEGVTPDPAKSEAKGDASPQPKGEVPKVEAPKVEAPKVEVKGQARLPEALPPDAKQIEPKQPEPKQAAIDPKTLERARTSGDDLLVIEEQRAPAGSSCKQLHFSGERPEISLLRSKEGRFPASDVNGLCALVYRRLASGSTYAIEIAEPLMRVTMDKGVFGRDRSGLKAGDIGRVLRDDMRGQMTYHIVLRPASGAASSSERRYVHELRR